MIDREQALILLEGLMERLKAFNASYERLSRMTGLSPESELSHNLHLFIGPCIDSLELLISGVNNGWIEWYIYDNKMGKSALTAGFTGKVKPIKNVEDLYWVMTNKG